MNYSARLSRRRIIAIDNKSAMAQWNISRQLGAMQCKRLGHVMSNPVEVGADKRTVGMCKRCYVVIDSGKAEANDGKSDKVDNGTQA